MRLETIKPRGEALLSALLPLWESSVKASHDFLTEAGLRELGPMVREKLREVATLTVCRDESGRIIAFMGCERKRLEMLFVEPLAWGQGAGGRLLAWAVQDLGVDYVEVNQQNPRAIGFYEKFGFRVVSRSGQDSQGLPYPLLRMRLQSEAEEAGQWQVLPSGILIRPFLPGEAGQVAFLHMRLYERQYGFRKIFEHYLLQGLADFVHAPAGGCLWLALAEEEIIGSAAIVRAGEAAQLRWLLIRRKYQGQGCGRALVEQALSFARAQGYPRVFLWTVQILETARHLYQQYGFVKSAEAPNREWAGRELTEERWELGL
jgi:GNAT superfamily N-acetyltransferase